MNESNRPVTSPDATARANSTGPDLEVAASVDDSSPETGGSITLSATVTNSGDAASGSTTLRYYRSSDSTIASSDTQVGTDTVGALAAAGTSDESVDLTAPSSAGTYYYGACVDAVAGESDTANNCSASVRAEVSLPLTATFEKLPATHDGQTAFTFELHFSEEPFGLSYRTVRDGLFDVTSGKVTNAGRVTQGSNLAFRVTVKPSKSSDISLTVRGTTDCEADHAVCTEDGRMLAGGTSATVPMGRPAVTMSVADTEVEEADGATLDFTVTLTRAATRNIGVSYRTNRGTATAGADYVAVDSTLTLTAGDTTGTISVVVLNDTEKEDPETVQLWLWGVRGMSASQVTDPHAVGTIHDSRPNPDLEVAASVDDSNPEAGGSITLSATVTNSGDGASDSTTLRYYRSSDSTITASDTQVGTDAVGALAAMGTSHQSADLTAPSSAGTYYYGACVDAVTGESDTANNCSASVRVEVSVPVPLTAKLEKLPATHDGRRTFRFEVHFSVEPSGLSYETVRDALFNVTNGDVTHAGRVTQGSDLAFRVTVKPSAARDISLTVRGTTDCEADHAVCTADGRKLAGGESAMVSVVFPDLEVAASVDDSSPVTGGSFTLSATVTNSHDAVSDSTTLRYYQSSDSIITVSDTQVGTDTVGVLTAADTSHQSVHLTAPSSAGTYYYGACVDGVVNEADTNNNCSASVRVHVEEPPPPAYPDLEVEASVGDGNPETGGSFALSATVTNSGDSASAATMLRYYRSSDATITASDTEVGTNTVGALAAAGTSHQSIDLTAPSSAGTYYYGACVDAVTGESDTGNNCSASVRVEVSVPLTARFEKLPATHDGRTAFTFEVHFNVEPSDLSYETIRDALFEVTNGGITKAGRVTPGRNLAFWATVEPSAASDISLTVNGTTDCEADHAVCTADGRKLAGGASDTVSAVYSDLEVAASVDDNSPVPRESLTLSVTVTNSGAAASDSTTLRYYQSSDSSITASDTQVGTDAVGALAAGHTSIRSVDLTAPSSAGTYYYGACVDTVFNESGASNNCSASVRVAVSDALTARFEKLPETHDGRTAFTFELHFSFEPPRLSVGTVRDRLFNVTNGGVTHAGRVTPGSNLAFRVTVEPSAASDISLTVRGTTDCEAARAVCTADGRRLAGGTSDTVSAVHPDLEVAVSADDNSPVPGGSFTLSATVTNSGDGASDSTALRYYQSSDSTITSSDTQVGTDTVDPLAAAGTSDRSVDLTAPSTSGTYYYGACLDTVANESDTSNNCSASMRLEVSDALTAKFANQPATHDGQTAFTFEVHFSFEPFDLSYETVRDSLFDVTNGRIASAGRVTQGSNLAFRVAVEPSAGRDISLTVRGTTDCEADHAVCTADGRKLAGGTSDTIEFNPAPEVTNALKDIDATPLERHGAYLPDVFTDPDGDDLTWTASSTDTSVARAGISGDSIIVNAVAEGSVTVSVTGTDPGGQSATDDFEVKVAAADFNMDLRFTSRVSEEQAARIREARDRWESILADTELANVTFDSEIWCADKYFESPGVVDDLLVFVDVVPIDGSPAAFNSLAHTDPLCYARDSDSTPVVSGILFDRSDIDRVMEEGLLVDLALHEFGHALGFVGDFFGDKGLLGRSDPHFKGALAIEAFDSAGGQAYEGAKVPLSTRFWHWRESAVAGELMSTLLASGASLSAITLQAMADLGYEVDVSQADDYEITDSGVGSDAGSDSDTPGEVYDLSRDVVRRPVRVVDTNGRIVRIIPPP